MNDKSKRIYSTVTSIEALWKMNPEKSLMDIIAAAAANTSNPPKSILSCDDETLLEGLYNLIENKYK